MIFFHENKTGIISDHRHCVVASSQSNDARLVFIVVVVRTRVSSMNHRPGRNRDVRCIVRNFIRREPFVLLVEIEMPNLGLNRFRFIKRYVAGHFDLEIFFSFVNDFACEPNGVAVVGYGWRVWRVGRACVFDTEWLAIFSSGRLFNRWNTLLAGAASLTKAHSTEHGFWATGSLAMVEQSRASIAIGAGENPAGSGIRSCAARAGASASSQQKKTQQEESATNDVALVL
mmetsp:Transcript_17276/g.39739  ORF Transcript_17276/g.39739 Transcript_17276/m.39739 type:complete len:230 (+) Transcript_17276:1323-2012(+)